jgi:RHS repeat-associated protein
MFARAHGPSNPGLVKNGPSGLHATSVITINNTLQDPVWRQFTPYGAPRSTATGTWPDTNGYLGDPANASDGLTTIGARQYDPATGRFLTPDPVLEAGDPTQMGGYAYAADNPVTNSDPTGLSVPGRSICIGNVNCNNPGDGPPSGWSGPGKANWNYKGTGSSDTGEGPRRTNNPGLVNPATAHIPAIAFTGAAAADWYGSLNAMNNYFTGEGSLANSRFTLLLSEVEVGTSEGPLLRIVGLVSKSGLPPRWKMSLPIKTLRSSKLTSSKIMQR